MQPGFLGSTHGLWAIARVLIVASFCAKHAHASEHPLETYDPLEALRWVNQQLPPMISILERVHEQVHAPVVDRSIVQQINLARQMTSALSALLLPGARAREAARCYLVCCQDSKMRIQGGPCAQYCVEGVWSACGGTAFC